MVKVSLQSGLAYLAILFLVAALSISMAVVTQNEDTLLKREKEQDWLFMGKQYQRAIASYYNQSPDGIKTLPNKIEDLLLDKRFIISVRHLRKAYYNPIDPQESWILIRNQQNQIIGVYNPSLLQIISTKIIAEYQENTGDKITNYSDVKFVFQPVKANPKASNDADEEPAFSNEP
jgi:hypothetical protein